MKHLCGKHLLLVLKFQNIKGQILVHRIWLLHWFNSMSDRFCGHKYINITWKKLHVLNGLVNDKLQKKICWLLYIRKWVNEHLTAWCGTFLWFNITFKFGHMENDSHFLGRTGRSVLRDSRVNNICQEDAFQFCVHDWTFLPGCCNIHSEPYPST